MDNVTYNKPLVRIVKVLRRAMLAGEVNYYASYHIEMSLEDGRVFRHFHDFRGWAIFTDVDGTISLISRALQARASALRLLAEVKKGIDEDDIYALNSDLWHEI
jgi:hypothetical protein